MTEKLLSQILVQIAQLRDQVRALDSSLGRALHRIDETEERIADIERHYEEFTTQVAARLEHMQIRQAEQAEQRDYPAQLPAAVPAQYVAGRWKQRDGNVYGRYTYQGNAATDPQLRRSPPATD